MYLPLDMMQAVIWTSHISSTTLITKIKLKIFQSLYCVHRLYSLYTEELTYIPLTTPHNNCIMLLVFRVHNQYHIYLIWHWLVFFYGTEQSVWLCQYLCVAKWDIHDCKIRSENIYENIGRPVWFCGTEQSVWLCQYLCVAKWDVYDSSVKSVKPTPYCDFWNKRAYKSTFSNYIFGLSNGSVIEKV